MMDGLAWGRHITLDSAKCAAPDTFGMRAQALANMLVVRAERLGTKMLLNAQDTTTQIVGQAIALVLSDESLSTAFQFVTAVPTPRRIALALIFHPSAQAMAGP